jgi:hypothetical protein
MSGFRHLKSIGTLLFLLPASVPAFAQITVKPVSQPLQLVKEVVVGKGIVVDNVRFMGMIQALGEFSNPSAQPFFSSGMVLSTGLAADIVGPNDNPKTSTVNGSPGDKNLAAIAGSRTFDGARLEFDFKAEKDSVTLNFIFASEEYNDFVGSTFNDVFAIVVSGPGIAGRQNLAVVPGTTTPVTVNSINPNQNRQYFANNNPYDLVGRINESVKANLNQTVLANFEFDGMTKVLSVGFRVTPRQVYHFEIVVSDAGDGTIDSAVLLEGGSFKSLEQKKHALRRQQLVAQHTADSLVRVQVVADSIALAIAALDSIATFEPVHVTEPHVTMAQMDSLKRSNQARLDSMARMEQVAPTVQPSEIPKTPALASGVEQQRQDSVAQIKQKQQPRDLGNPPLPPLNLAPAATEVKETILFEIARFDLNASTEKQLLALGKLLAAQSTWRAGVYLPQGEDGDLLNLRYEIIRLELVRGGGKSQQIFRNGFSFAQPSGEQSAQRAEIWIRKEQ